MQLPKFQKSFYRQHPQIKLAVELLVRPKAEN